MLNKAACSWQHLSSKEKSKTGGGGGGGEGGDELSVLFFSAGENASMLQSACLLAKKNPTWQQTHAREVRKRWKREGETYLRTRWEEGAIWPSRFTITLIQREEWESRLGGKLHPRVCLDLILKVWCFFYRLLTFTERVLQDPKADLTPPFSLMFPFSPTLHCLVLLLLNCRFSQLHFFSLIQFRLIFTGSISNPLTCSVELGLKLLKCKCW